jgi:hypothetical protein
MNNDSTAQAGTTTEAQKVEQEQKTEKTFTQAEMNKIVQERLAKERAKYEGFDDLKEKAMKFDELQEANKSELEKAQAKVKALEEQIATAKREKEISDIRTKVANEKGLPVELLNGDTEEACEAQADAILNFAQLNGYPSVKDGGEPARTSKLSPEEQFKRWAKENL